MAAGSHHLFVCTSCRRAGEPKHLREERAGARLFRTLSDDYARWARREDFSIVSYECLSACQRPCAGAMRAPGKFMYLFGDVRPEEDASAVIECATQYRRAAAGFLPRGQRPTALQAGILARVPPVEEP